MHRGVLRSLTTWFCKQVPLGDNRKKKPSIWRGFFMLMIYLDYMKKKLFKRLSLFVFFVFLLNTAGSFFSWYTLLPWYDNMMHFLGGAWLGLVFCWMFVHRIEEHKTGIIQLLIFVLVGALLWEVLEYVVQYITQSPGALASPLDSVSDVVFGLLGGWVLGSYTIRSIRKK